MVSQSPQVCIVWSCAIDGIICYCLYVSIRVADRDTLSTEHALTHALAEVAAHRSPMEHHQGLWISIYACIYL